MLVPPPPVIGHRGAAGCAPENTLAGLVRAKALGCRWVEFDVRLSADGVPIVLHDDRLDRTTDGRGRVSALSLPVIRRCDAGVGFDLTFAGERVPTLDEMIALLGDLGLGANIELKAEPGRAAKTGAVVADRLARQWPSHLPAPLFSSFSPEALSAARDRAPQFPRGLLVGAVPSDWCTRAEMLGCVSIHVDHRRLDPATVVEIRQSGYAVLAYTVNRPAQAHRLFKWGVASVFSDVPHIILAAVADGYPPRAAGDDDLAPIPRLEAAGETA